jgi:hypothetical protein
MAMTDNLNNILTRLSALEAAFHHQNVAPQSADDRRLGKRGVALREGKSIRSIDRGVKNGTFPAADAIINGRHFWWLSTLQRHDRERIRGTTRTPNRAGKSEITARSRRHARARREGGRKR